MKIAYLSGAYKNSGDFLIEKRAVELIRHVYPEAEIVRFLRNEIADNTTAINCCDFAVIGGGPIFKQTLKGYMPLDLYCREIQRPTMILGGGWYGRNGSSFTMRGYRFDSQTKDFLKHVYASGFGFSCRDLQTLNILRANGFSRSVMTGCPAWYDTRYVGQDEFRRESEEIRKIYVSDPSKLYNLDSLLLLVDYLTERFPGAALTVLFHRGIEKDAFTSGKSASALTECVRKLEEKGVAVRDISFGAEGFSAYDDCDLHIGFRVHAHIYNLSVRNRTILLEEDGRGAGVNETLGMPSIRAYDDRTNVSNRCLNMARYGAVQYQKPNPSLVNELDNYLALLQSIDYAYLTNAFRLQNTCYEHMLAYLRQLSEGAAYSE